MNDKNNIGKLIKQYRTKSGMTQLELAKSLDYDIPQFISLIENGHSKAPVEVVGKLIEILNIPQDQAIDALISTYREEISKVIKFNKKAKSKSKKIG